MTELEEALRFQEALRGELWNRAEAADREVSLIGSVDRRVRRVRRRRALTASVLATIAGAAVVVAASASSGVPPAVTVAGTASGIAVLQRSEPAPEATPAAGLVRSASDPTVAHSVSLAYGPRVRVPAGWRWHHLGGILLAAPASWAIRRDIRRGRCPDGGAPVTVVLSTTTVRYVPGCLRWQKFLDRHELKSVGTTQSHPIIITVPVRHAAADVASNPAISLCQRLGGMRACVLWPGNSLLKVSVFPLGKARRTVIEIRQMRSAATARAIFGSIRPAPTRRAAPQPSARRTPPPRWGHRTATIF